MITERLFLRPGVDFLYPLSLVAAIELTAVETGVLQHPLNLSNLFPPLCFHGVNARNNVLMAFGQRLFRCRRGFELRSFALQPAIEGFQQIARTFPRFMNDGGDLPRQRIAMSTPEVCAGLVTQPGFIFDQLLLKEHAGLKGIETQHPLTKAVNGKYRRFVHLSFRQQQRIRRLVLIRNFSQQSAIEGIGRAVAQAGNAQLVDIAANTAAQFFGGRFGEGHHQQLFHADRTRKGGFPAKSQQ